MVILIPSRIYFIQQEGTLRPHYPISTPLSPVRYPLRGGFVALFPYDPATMSPNPDAAEEELPFTEGQIIKVCPRRALTTGTLIIMHVLQSKHL